MGAVQPPRPVVLIMAVFSRYDEAFLWAEARANRLWGPTAAASERFPFDYTSYYQNEMGPELTKQFFAFERLADPSELPDWKLQSNAWELEYASQSSHPEPRPLNLDPGYITEAKLVLATTKDRDHRLYLRDGIYAEGTLFYHRGEWRERPWTYPDYQQDAYHRFFTQCRNRLREQFKSSGESSV